MNNQLTEVGQEETKEKGVEEALAKQPTTPESDNLNDNDIISQNAENTQDKNDTSDVIQETEQKKEHKGSTRVHKCLNPHSKVHAFAIKCYDEQLKYDWATTVLLLKGIDKSGYHILGIRHYKDLKLDPKDFWKASIEKPHYHIIIRCVGEKQRIRVLQMMAMLGIEFRQGLDEELWQNHGVESIGNFRGYAVYLTHETLDAIRDGKELYEEWEIVSNLTEEEVQQVRDGYLRLFNTKRITPTELTELDELSFKMGYEMNDFSEWYNTLPFSVRSHGKMKTIRESYDRGVDLRISENTQICRMCLFIHGEGNVGKTYAAKQALTELSGKRTLVIDSEGTGKFDNLRADHEALVLDDIICPNLLNMADNRMCRVYRRNQNNPVWSGKYLIVTSNLTFREWVRQCGIKTDGKQLFGCSQNSDQYNAIISRFCIGRVMQSEAGYNQLYISKMSDRGSYEVRRERLAMMNDFLYKYNSIISQYNPSNIVLDESSVITDLSRFGSII